MPHLLHLDSSADLDTSRSRAIGQTFVDAWLEADPQNTVTHRDLHRAPLPHLADSSLHWPEHARPEGSNPPAEAVALQAALIEELLTADVVLVGAPLYNYSMPSTLKAWIDHIHVPGITAGDKQPMAGRPAVIISSRGVSYDEGSPTAGWDHAVPALQLILGTSLGMPVTLVSTSLTLAEAVPELADQIERGREELALAHEEAASAGSRLGGMTRLE
ncbi:NAD(P)H-dependent oxidoreductase [Conyzicola nivalis]|uniref:FMN dependent NADH:quinone oxidoreductase n=1 Tax=Conyzicola nivalis TaxID=1477021 RepID=A0A916SI39_9MICO|nr:NAD(P)H-dependent oxidoreductase [Conyzicola nivalis]GGA98575.1 FMN-dependent NADH-azoreductase [Conyzicola nivalis]